MLVRISNKIYHWIDRYIGIPLCLLLSPFRRFPLRQSGAFKKILAVRIGMIGDAILLIPSLRALREKFNDSHVVILCSEVNKEVFKNCPYLDQIIAVKFDDLINPFRLLAVINKLRSFEFDLVIDFEQWLRASALISFFSLARERIGFKTPGQFRHYLFTKTMPHIRNQHELECFLDLLKPLDIFPKNKNLELFNIGKCFNYGKRNM